MRSVFIDYLHTQIDIYAQNKLARQGRYDELQDRIQDLSNYLSDEEIESALRISKELYKIDSLLTPRQKSDVYNEAIHSFYPDDVAEITANEVWEGGYGYV
jgi:hypothetical protein